MLKSHEIFSNDAEGKLDIAFVIPSYREGTEIIDLLSSIAIHGVIEGVKVGVFVVVNNSQNASQEDIESNTITAGLLMDIIQSNPNLSKYSEALQGQILDIMCAGINLYSVDAYSEKGALEICNVGVARDIGTKSALDLLKNERSLIVSTDADCEINDSFTKELVEVFHPSILPKDLDSSEDLPSIGTGNRVFVENEGEEKVYQKYKEICGLEEGFHRVIRRSMGIYEFQNSKTIHFTPGSYTIFTKELFELIDGYEHIKGAEDVSIGMKAMQKGYDIVYCKGASITTKSRVSSRTEDGHGFGNSIRDKGSVSTLELHTNSIENMRATEFFKHFFSIAHSQFQDDAKKWTQYMYSTLQSCIPGYKLESIEKLARIYFKYIGGKNSTISVYPEELFPLLFAEFKIELESYLPKKSIFIVAQEVNDLISSIDESSEFFSDAIGMQDRSINKKFLFGDNSNYHLYLYLMRLKLADFHNINILEKFQLDYERSILDLERKIIDPSEIYPKIGKKCINLLQDITDLNKIDNHSQDSLISGQQDAIIHFLIWLYEYIESVIFRLYGVKMKVSFSIFDIDKENEKTIQVVKKLDNKIAKLKIPVFLKKYDLLVDAINEACVTEIPKLESRMNLELLSSDWFDSE